MTDRTDGLPANALLLVSVLEKLRTRTGLTIDRLHAGRIGPTAPLLDLAATRFPDVRDLDTSRAAFDLVLTMVRDQLCDTQQIVADTILALCVHERTYVDAGIDARVTRSLYHTTLGRRRLALLKNWDLLHNALNLTPPEAPRDRTLRGTTEPEVLRELAKQLVRRDRISAGSAIVTTRERAPTDSADQTGRVVVVGGAVMDATFRIKSLPASETSTEAYDFNLSPGGKGLTQAIASARLGLRTSLVAAVANDHFGEQILEHLGSAGVDTSLIKRVKGPTPFTGVFEKELGDSIAVNWRNKHEVFLSQKDMDERADHLVGSDVLMTTFEVPRETMQRTLALAHREPDNRPLVIVTPGQPYTDERINHETFAQIDYLVAHAWELGPFAPAGEVPFSPEPVARKLVTFGVETLCLLANGGCTIYSHPGGHARQVPAIPSIYKESSGARDAFCAALAAKLIENDRKFSDEGALWAVAAMSCAATDFRENSMPDRERIETLLSRSALRPRDTNTV